MHSVKYSQATGNARLMMTPSGTIMKTFAGNSPQMILGPGQNTVITRQSGYAPINTNPTMLLEQPGANANQQFHFSPNTVACQNQIAALQPNSFNVSSMSVHPSMLNGNPIQGMLPQPQIINTQTSRAVVNQAELQASGLQLYQSPMIFYNQPLNIQTQMQPPVAAPRPNKKLPIVSRSPLLDSSSREFSSNMLNTSEEKEIRRTEKKTRILRARDLVELSTCEVCGKLGSHFRYKWKKRFCSKSCVKQFKKLPVIQDNVDSGKYGPNKKKRRGRKSLQKQVSRSPLLDSSCREFSSNMLNTSSNMLNTSEEKEIRRTGNYGPNKKKRRGRKSLQKQVIDEKENTNVAAAAEENPSIPEDESIVSCKTEEENFISSSDSPHSTSMEVDKSNFDMGKSDLSRKLPSKWTVQDVFEFVQDFAGCTEYADNFKSQEVDGRALFLLNEDHLMTALCMKLGPALKLLSRIKIIEQELQS